MKLSDITGWLAGTQPWAQGVALYAALGSSATYQRLFALGATDYSRQVLLRELRALAEPVAVVLPLPTDQVARLRLQLPQAVFEKEYLNIPPATVPASPVLAGLRTQLKAVRDERSHLHPQLTGKGVGIASRYALADRILELTDQEVKLKSDEAHVLEHGRLPGRVASAEVNDTGVLRQRLTNLLSLRSKLKKRPDRAADLAAVEAEIILIRSKLTPETCLTN